MFALQASAPRAAVPHALAPRSLPSPPRSSLSAEEPGPLQQAADYLYLVHRVADRMARRLPRVVDIGDLMSAGTLGLLDAMEKYDPSRCDRFSAYAEIRIRGAILDELRAMDWVPRSVRSKGHQLDEALARLASSFGRLPTEAELADYLDLTLEELAEVRKDVQNIAVVAVNDLSEEGFASFAADQRLEPGHELDARESRARLARALARLPDKERQVLSLYYLEDLKLKEIGEVLGVSESRVCQIHAQAMERLRKLVAAQEWQAPAPK